VDTLGNLDPAVSVGFILSQFIFGAHGWVTR
jgi:hypothetical protein